MRRLAAFTVLTLLTIFAALPVLGWTLQDCVEVNFDHPDCDQYPTTTTTNNPCDEYSETRHPECQTTTTYQTTTTAPEVTTTTSDNTTTTQQETTTTGFTQQTTTTVQECADGLIHQPPLCVDPSTTTVPATSADTTAPVTVETLPFTGSSGTGTLALAALASLVLGLAMVRKARTA